jgi:hypothetical protein
MLFCDECYAFDVYVFPGPGVDAQVVRRAREQAALCKKYAAGTATLSLNAGAGLGDASLLPPPPVFFSFFFFKKCCRVLVVVFVLLLLLFLPLFFVFILSLLSLVCVACRCCFHRCSRGVFTGVISTFIFLVSLSVVVIFSME